MIFRVFNAVIELSVTSKAITFFLSLFICLLVFTKNGIILQSFLLSTRVITFVSLVVITASSIES